MTRCAHTTAGESPALQVRISKIDCCQTSPRRDFRGKDRGKRLSSTNSSLANPGGQLSINCETLFRLFCYRWINWERLSPLDNILGESREGTRALRAVSV